VLALFQRVGRSRGVFWALLFSAASGLLLAYYFWRRDETMAAFFFAIFGLKAAADAAQASREGPTPAPEADQALAGARQLLERGELEPARERLLPLASDASPLVRAQAHQLLGWVALRQGEGRRALDHFAQVQRLPVEAKALAAAFSLVGDDGRALPLWEQAYGSEGGSTLLHEWAGTLLRLGRRAEALALPGVNTALAFGCAERVLYLRGAFLQAAVLGEEGVSLAPTPTGAYDAACSYARAGRLEDAARLLRRAIALGFRDLRHAEEDPDLAELRMSSHWRDLTGELWESDQR
jgi:hypothetical protein